MEKIEVIGINNLTDEEKKITNTLLKEYISKIERIVKNDILIKMHVKEYKKDGKGKKYSLHFEVIFAGKMINSNAWDYDLSRTIHKAMKKIEIEAEHTFHSSEQK